jgi:hypothetical protein
LPRSWILNRSGTAKSLYPETRQGLHHNRKTGRQGIALRGTARPAFSIRLRVGLFFMGRIMAGSPKKSEGHTLLRFPIFRYLDRARPREDEKKLRRRVEDRLRKDRQALLLVARILDIE